MLKGIKYCKKVIEGYLNSESGHDAFENIVNYL